LGFVHSQTHLQLFFSFFLFFSLENFYSPSWVTKHTVPTVIPAESPYSDIKKNPPAEFTAVRTNHLIH
jgi:hypothetical protein